MRRSTQRPARSAVAVLAYLVGFVALLLIVSHFYLLPTFAEWHNADPVRRKLLSAQALLVLSVFLCILLVGLLLTFRIGRFFRPRPFTPSAPTKYTDAWTESAKRMKTPERDEPEDVDE